MPTPRFPATAILLDAKRCPLDKFDALFTKITQERRIFDGYFRHDHPGETRFLFVVNGSPYGSGRVVEEACTFHEVHEFFAAYADHPETPLSFFVADKRLLLGLMVLFRRQPALTFKTNLVDVVEMMETLAERKTDQILAVRSEGDWAISLMAKGRLAATFLPLGVGDPGQVSDPTERLAAYVGGYAAGAAVDVYEETRIEPAGDVILVTPETRGRLSEVFLQVAARVHEEEAPPLTLDASPAEPAILETDAAAPVLPVDDARIDETPSPLFESEAAPLELEGPMSARAEGEPASTPPAPSFPVPEVALFLGEKHIGTFSLAGGEVTIGRTPSNTIAIDNAGVSRRHAVIRAKGDKVILEDLGSANGTFIRGQKVQEHELQDGDEITIVKHRLLFRLPKEGEAAPKPEPATDAGQRTMYIDAAMVAQAVGSRLGARPEGVASALRPRLILPDLKKFALEMDEVSMGTASGCQIQLSGMFVGKVHARIVRTKEGQFKIQHVGGLAGTRVNGEKISEHLLKHGDEIEIGKQRLLFRLER